MVTEEMFPEIWKNVVGDDDNNDDDGQPFLQFVEKPWDGEDDDDDKIKDELKDEDEDEV